MSSSKTRRYRSRKGSGEVYVRSNSNAFRTLFSSLMKYFLGIENRREDYSMKDERTSKEGLSSCSSLPASMIEVTASTMLSGAALLVTA